MNYIQQDVLKILVKKYKETGINSIETVFCNATQNIALKELENSGYITVESELTGNVRLADFIVESIQSELSK